MTHSNAASERTFSMGNNIGKVLSVILSQWINVSVVTPSFSWSEHVLQVGHLIQRLFFTVISFQSFPFPGGNHVLVRFNIITPMQHNVGLLVSQSARKICSLSLDHAMRSM